MARKPGKSGLGVDAKTSAGKGGKSVRARGAGEPVAKSTSKAGSGARPGSGAQVSAAAASRLIDERVHELGGWRGETLARMRALILEADPEMTEEWKWMGTPVWSHHGIICTGETYAKVVKLTFARGAAIPDPSHLFNASLEGNTRRAIDIREGATIDADAFTAHSRPVRV